MAIKHRRKRKSRRARRKRSNPTVPVIFANPRRRRRRKRSAAPKVTRRRRRRSRLRRSAGRVRRRRVSRRRRRSNPGLMAMLGGRKRRRRRRRSHSRRRLRVKRRSNPGRLRLGGIISILRVGVAGGLGIVVSRMGANLYRKHLSGAVTRIVGTSTIGSLVDECLRLAAMGAATHLGHMVLQKVKIARPVEVSAFKIGGYAEMGRQAIGQVVLKRLSPGISLSNYGLDGYGMGELEPSSSFEGLGDSDLESLNEFDSSGMGDLEYSSSFEGAY